MLLSNRNSVSSTARQQQTWKQVVMPTIGEEDGQGEVGNNCTDADRDKLVSEKLYTLATHVTTMHANELNAEFLQAVPNLRILTPNDNTVALQTTIRDINSAREDFVFDSDRLIRLVIEEALNHLPSMAKTVITPPGGAYAGVRFPRSNCGVSIVRSGEAMERGLRDVCRAIRIGKILIEKTESHSAASHSLTPTARTTARVLYAKLPDDVSLRKVLLLYPIMNTGATVIEAIRLLLERNAKEANIILINLFATPQAIKAVSSCFAEVTIQTVDIHPLVPMHFGIKYFGTD